MLRDLLSKYPLWAWLMVLVAVAALIGAYGHAMYRSSFEDGLENYIEDNKARDIERVFGGKSW